jgi:hypothetical protein
MQDFTFSIDIHFQKAFPTTLIKEKQFQMWWGCSRYGSTWGWSNTGQFNFSSLENQLVHRIHQSPTQSVWVVEL